MLACLAFVAVELVSGFDPFAPPFLISTNDGETIEILDYIVVEPIDLAVSRIEAQHGGIAIGEKTVQPGSTEEILIDSSGLPSGLNTLTLKARDASGAILHTDTVDVFVRHPILSAVMTVDANGFRELSYTVRGLDGDQLYAVFASSILEPSYSVEFSTLAPVGLVSAPCLEVSSFPDAYDGSTTMVGYQALGPVSANDDVEFHLELLTFQGGVWRASNAVTITNPDPPTAGPPVAPGVSEPKDD